MTANSSFNDSQQGKEMSGSSNVGLGVKDGAYKESDKTMFALGGKRMGQKIAASRMELQFK